MKKSSVSIVFIVLVGIFSLSHIFTSTTQLDQHNLRDELRAKVALTFIHDISSTSGELTEGARSGRASEGLHKRRPRVLTKKTIRSALEPDAEDRVPPEHGLAPAHAHSSSSYGFSSVASSASSSSAAETSTPAAAVPEPPAAASSQPSALDGTDSPLKASHHAKASVHGTPGKFDVVQRSMEMRDKLRQIGSSRPVRQPGAVATAAVTAASRFTHEADPPPKKGIIPVFA
ncbi:hypothetical protein CYMTET_30536, partial [Cymbomonas tetramitiformis]